MNFFKRFFSNKKENNSSETKSNNTTNKHQKAEINAIGTREYFDKRYQEDTIDDSMIDGTLKMIEGYFTANKLKPQIQDPINHPKNLDQTIDDGFGFIMYCQAAQMDENFAVGILAMAFNDFMIKTYGFKLYKDSEPEYPLRDMTLKYDNQGAKLSLYPIEYTAKVINYEANFEDLHQRIKTNLEQMPTSDEVYNTLMNSLKDSSKE